MVRGRTVTPEKEQLCAAPSSDHERRLPRNRADELAVRATQRETKHLDGLPQRPSIWKLSLPLSPPQDMW